MILPSPTWLFVCPKNQLRKFGSQRQWWLVGVEEMCVVVIHLSLGNHVRVQDGRPSLLLDWTYDVRRNLMAHLPFVASQPATDRTTDKDKALFAPKTQWMRYIVTTQNRKCFCIVGMNLGLSGKQSMGIFPLTYIPGSPHKSPFTFYKLSPH